MNFAAHGGEMARNGIGGRLRPSHQFNYLFIQCHHSGGNGDDDDGCDGDRSDTGGRHMVLTEIAATATAAMTANDNADVRRQRARRDGVWRQTAVVCERERRVCRRHSADVPDARAPPRGVVFPRLFVSAGGDDDEVVLR